MDKQKLNQTGSWGTDLQRSFYALHTSSTLYTLRYILQLEKQNDTVSIKLKIINKCVYLVILTS